MVAVAEDRLISGLARLPRSDAGLKVVDRRFAEWLTRARSSQKMTYEALAERVEIHPTYAQKLERGVRPAPKRDVVEKMARALTPAGAAPEEERAILREALLAAGFTAPDPSPPSDLPVLPERVADLPPDLQEALRYIMGLRDEVRPYMLKLWVEQARPHLEMQTDMERRRLQLRREIEALDREAEEARRSNRR